MVAALESNNSIIPNLNSSGNDSSVYKRSSFRAIGGYLSSVMAEPCISCTTFNILAPIYKRLDDQNQSLRESDFKESWFNRNQTILDWLLYERSSIICLQEFWVGNEELVRMYQERLGDAGYITFKLARTNNRGDGLLTALHQNYFRVLNYRELLFNDFGDRVAQLLHVQSVVPFLPSQKNCQQEILIVNTHLLFPHDSSLSVVRLHQVYKILQYLEAYQTENELNRIPIILCGDWNGSKRGHVYKFLRSRGFVSSYDNAHQYTDCDADAHKWVSHRNHRGNICGVDFIWLHNPGNKSRKPLQASWAEAVFGIIKNQLQRASLAEDDAFAFLKADNNGDVITYSAFCEALRQVNLVGQPYGLSCQETNDLWKQADIDGNGVVSYEEFKRMWNSTCSVQIKDNFSDNTDTSKECTEQEIVGFTVKNAFLFPREVEKGLWPENYSLSDHARLSVVFSPMRMPGP
ncbi:uncharacterized calcium-binding protein At1g02270-like isoform X2 [Mangifera indica]|uniref:uncharacterized calcium-binding protein At1g02270-like isoform X2 n=1 Tax=Mangifera indica TaxID=29780 RepID=UPI001CFAC0FB|nr:uncharacterized calcium-binding protein At1g02270-like isoform X2 [Mangifera indica]